VKAFNRVFNVFVTLAVLYISVFAIARWLLKF